MLWLSAIVIYYAKSVDRNIVLHNWMCNLTGKVDGWQGWDWLQEKNNLYTKLLMHITKTMSTNQHYWIGDICGAGFQSHTSPDYEEIYSDQSLSVSTPDDREQLLSDTPYHLPFKPQDDSHNQSAKKLHWEWCTKPSCSHKWTSSWLWSTRSC